jgi:hypothetical protein
LSELLYCYLRKRSTFLTRSSSPDAVKKVDHLDKSEKKTYTPNAVALY